ncbi:MAG TPA: hypothetical protein ENG48_11155 [Candidatus Atribacteria bacterium]|nr:hypothetical protein [Candidatus Atribacteria bacterium]
MKRYLLDVSLVKNELLINKLIRKPENDTPNELSRMEWQLHHADEDVFMGDLHAIAIYRPSMENIEKYEGGVAYYEGEDLIDKIMLLLHSAKLGNHKFAGWGIKTFTIPVLFRALLMAGQDVEILFDIMDTYPFDTIKTIDLYNEFNFNGQMSTVRARNRYSLQETCLAYGLESDYEKIKERGNSEEILRERLRLQKYLFELRGFSWE